MISLMGKYSLSSSRQIPIVLKSMRRNNNNNNNNNVLNYNNIKLLLQRRQISHLKTNVLRNDPYIPIYAGVTTLVLLGVLTIYKNYSKVINLENDIAIARNDIIDALHANYTSCLDANNSSDLIAPTLINLCWSSSSTYSRHDFTGGIGGATIRFSPEKDYKFNKGLEKARLFLETIKEKHPLISYSDLYSLAAVIAIESLGGPVVPWVSGRKDVSEDNVEKHQFVAESRCPVTHSGSIENDVDHIKVLFGRIGGLSYKHIVVLFGAHSVGRCHQSSSGHTGTWTRDETKFSNEYFRLLLSEQWSPKKMTSDNKPWEGPLQYENKDRTLTMLPIDIALLNDPDFRSFVEFYADNEKDFLIDFAFAFEKLINNGVEEETNKRGLVSRVMGF